MDFIGENTYYSAVAISALIMALVGIIPVVPLRKLIILAGFSCFMFTSYLTVFDLLSRPKPVDTILWLDRPDVETAKIVGYHVVPQESIYMLLLWKGILVPRYYEYPWTKELAEALQNAEKDAKESGNERGLEFGLPFDRSLENQKFPDIHPIPQIKRMFPKPSPQDRIIDHQHQDDGDSA